MLTALCSENILLSWNIHNNSNVTNVNLRFGGSAAPGNTDHIKYRKMPPSQVNRDRTRAEMRNTAVAKEIKASSLIQETEKQLQDDPDQSHFCNPTTALTSTLDILPTQVSVLKEPQQPVSHKIESKACEGQCSETAVGGEYGSELGSLTSDEYNVDVSKQKHVHVNSSSQCDGCGNTIRDSPGNRW